MLSLLAAFAVHASAAMPAKPMPGKPAAAPSAPVNPAKVDTSQDLDLSQFGRLTSSTLPQEAGIPIVARVNGNPVFWDSFEIQARLTGAQLFHKNPGKEESIFAVLSVPLADTLVTHELYRHFAETHSLSIHPSEINQRLQTLLAGAEPSARLALSQLSEEQKKKLVTITLTQEKVDKYIGDTQTSAPASQQELSAFLATSPTTASVEIIRARHIVIRATPDMSEFNLNDAKAHADEVLAKVQAKMDFAAAARQFSQDRFTAYRGGDLGYFNPTTMYKEFTEATKELKPGQVSGVVRTPVGFHIIQLLERHPDDTLLQLDKYRKRTAVDHWKQAAIKSAKVENYLKP